MKPRMSRRTNGTRILRRPAPAWWQGVAGMAFAGAVVASAAAGMAFAGAVPSAASRPDPTHTTPPGDSVSTTPPAEHPAFRERRDAREAMVQDLLRYRHLAVTDSSVLAAMGRVPRHRFVPEDQRRHAYADSPVPIGHGQTISQPYIVALMTQLAQIDRGMKVLEVGTGSGYQAAVLAELTPHVFTVEIVRPLAERAAATLGELGYDSVTAREADGYHGWPGEAPFQRILVTAAAAHIPPPLIQQLAPGGRMVIPVGPRWGTQQLLVVTRDAEGKVQTESVLPVRFVPLVGGED